MIISILGGYLIFSVLSLLWLTALAQFCYSSEIMSSNCRFWTAVLGNRPRVYCWKSAAWSLIRSSGCRCSRWSAEWGWHCIFCLL